jgi:DNA repair protein RadC
MTYDIVSIRKRKTVNIKRVSDVYEVIKRYAKSDKEQFLVMTLDSSHDVIAIHIATIGLVNRTIVHPREVFIHAIRDNAVGVVVCHNHPSESVEPSEEDKKLTDDLKEAAKILGIRFLDHIIITKSGYYSFREKGALE